MTFREVVDLEAAPARGVLRLELIDDDPLSRQFLRSALAGVAGLAVHVAERDGEPTAAGDAGDQHPGQPVVVMACVPDRAVHLERLRALTAARRRVLLTGVHWTKESIREALEAGASGCTVKSLDINGLVAALIAVASGHVVISPELLTVHLGVPDRPAVPADDHALELITKLTDRELEVLMLLTAGMSTGDAARRLGVSLATVNSHVSHVLTKFGVRNRTQAVLLAKEYRLMELAAPRRRRR